MEWWFLIWNSKLNAKLQIQIKWLLFESTDTVLDQKLHQINIPIKFSKKEFWWKFLLPRWFFREIDTLIIFFVKLIFSAKKLVLGRKFHSQNSLQTIFPSIWRNFSEVAKNLLIISVNFVNYFAVSYTILRLSSWKKFLWRPRAWTA